MANLPISGFPTGGTIAQAGDEFVIARSGANYKLTSSSISAFVLGGPTTQLGAADVASGAVAQTLQVQSNTGAATTGPNFTIKGSAGTTAGGSIIFQTHNGTAYATALQVLPNGIIQVGSSTAFQNFVGIGTPSINVGSGSPITASGSYAGDQINLYSTGTNIASINSSGIRLASTHSVGWGSGASIGGADLFLARDNSNILALKNSTNPQIFRAYSTTTGPSYGYFASGVTDAGVATADTLFIGTGGVGAAMTKLALVVNGTSALSFSGTAATFAAGVTTGATITSGQGFGTGGSNWDFTFTGRTKLIPNGVGILTLANSAVTDFDRLQFGGTTSSFPALKRTPSGASLQVRLADDSGDAALQCGTATSGGTAFNVNGTGGSSIASITNTSTGTLLQVLNSTSNPLMTVTDTTSGTLFSVQSTTAATLFSVNDTTSGTLLAVTNSSSQDIFSVTDAGVFGADGASANVLAIKNSTTEQRLRIYNTTASSGSYFFVGAGVNDDGTVSANTLNIGTGGAGAALSKFAVVVNGTTRLDYNASSGSNWTATGTMRAQAFEATNSDFKAPSGGYFYWASRAQMKSPADKVMVVEDSAAGPAIIQTKQFTVTNLPAATSYAGAMAFVSDATATTPRSTVAGGGSNKVMVMSDGTNWLIVA